MKTSQITRQIYRQARQCNRSCTYDPSQDIYRLPREDRLSLLSLMKSFLPIKIDPLEIKSMDRKAAAEWRAIGWE